MIFNQLFLWLIPNFSPHPGTKRFFVEFLNKFHRVNKSFRIAISAHDIHKDIGAYFKMQVGCVQVSSIFIANCSYGLQAFLNLQVLKKAQGFNPYLQILISYPLLRMDNLWKGVRHFAMIGFTLLNIILIFYNENAGLLHRYPVPEERLFFFLPLFGRYPAGEKGTTLKSRFHHPA
jgi:hypothetical protein